MYEFQPAFNSNQLKLLVYAGAHALMTAAKETNADKVPWPFSNLHTICCDALNSMLLLLLFACMCACMYRP
jgi:hypothetical protein